MLETNGKLNHYKRMKWIAATLWLTAFAPLLSGIFMLVAGLEWQTGLTVGYPGGTRNIDMGTLLISAGQAWAALMAVPALMVTAGNGHERTEI